MTSNTELREAKKLLLKKLSGTILESEEKQLDVWREKDPLNQALFDRVLSEQFLSRAILDENEQKNKDSWQKLYYKLGYTRKARLHTSIYKWVAAAIISGILLGTGWYFYHKEEDPTIYAGSSMAYLHITDTDYPLSGEILNYSEFIQQLEERSKTKQSKQVDISPNLLRTIKVPRSAEYKILLEDGSLIHLGPESSLTIPANFSKENRTVNLAGEAYLDIQKDSLHPFVIQTRKVNIQVLGTQLNVEAYEDEPEIKVTLEKGIVELDSGKERKALPVGYTATINRDKQIEIEEANIYECTAWHHNRLVFYDQSMETVMRKISRWYDIEASFSSDWARDFKITMDVDKHESLNNLMEMIQMMDELKIEVQKNKVLISKND